MRFGGRVIVEVGGGEGEDRSVFGRYGGGYRTVVDVGVYHYCTGYFFSALESADGYGYIVDGAEAFAVAGIGVVEAAADVRAEAVLEGGFGGSDCATGG